MVGVAINVACILGAQTAGLLSHLPPQFREVQLFSAPWIAYLVATTFRTAVSTAAQAALKFRELFIWGVVAAALSLVMIVGLVARVGAVGAPIGLAVSELALGIGIWMSLGKGPKPGETAVEMGQANIGTYRCAL